MVYLAPWDGLSIEQSEVAIDDDAEGLLAQTPHWSVRKGSCGGAPIVLYSCRPTPLRLELWTVALDTLQQFVAPYSHPNLVQFLGVVTPLEHLQHVPTASTDLIAMEHIPLSLYDVLYRDQISLSRREIALVAIQILRGLLFLHRKQQPLGVCLTSKKVMLDGTSRIKLRRFGLEMMLRTGKAPSQLSCTGMKTVYEMAADPHAKLHTSAPSSSSSPSATSCRSAQPSSPCELTSVISKIESFTSLEQDLFAFGVLLLEMCAREKPTNELFNRISCAKQVDSVFHDVLQLTLPLGGIVVGDRRNKPPLVTTEHLLEILVANEQQRAGEELRLSSASFPCFLYADRYFASKEAEQVELKQRERDRRENIDLKRLGAVEKELIEEQKNFEVLVLQLEQVQKEKAEETRKKHYFQDLLAAQEQKVRLSEEDTKQQSLKAQEHMEYIISLQASLDGERQKAEALQAARISDAEEKQGLLIEILKLKEEKRKLTAQNQELEAEYAAVASKLGGEKSALEDLEGRLTQALHRWEEEQRVRRKADRQAEAISRQLLQMEEERCKYSNVLQQSPTGKRAPNASLSYVLTLKDKEIEDLSLQLQTTLNDQVSLQTNITRREADCCALCAENDTLRLQYENAQNEACALNSQLEERNDFIASLRERLQQANAEIETLNSRITDFEEEVDRQAKKQADEEKARKLRQCLTPQCDAPRYLVGSSGYCKECEERAGHSGSGINSKQMRHRRHRSWDDASSMGGGEVRKNARNAPVMKLVNVLREEWREGKSANDGDSRVEDTNLQQLLGALKQLIVLLKADESLKDDLPECLAIKSVLALMHQHNSDLVIQPECCKCLSVIVFNHDRNRLIVVAEGGVDPVLAAMKRFQTESKMQETSCVLLTNLAHHCETNRKRILDAGGIDAVLQAMQTFPEHCNVQKRCCWALLTLAGSDFLCDSIAMRGGLGAIIAAMLNCPADENVQFYGSWALVNLLSGTVRLKAFARREGVKEVAEAAFACFPEHEGIQEKTREILRLLV